MFGSRGGTSMRQVRHIRAGLAATAAIALAAPAAPALANGFGLNLVPQSEAVVGRPMVVQASGTIPPADIQFPYWFSLDAIPTSFTTTCPPDEFEGAQFAQASGGGILVLTQPERPDLAGNFTIPVAVTPSAAGSVLLCGYTDDGAATTLAATALILSIKPAPSSQPDSGFSRPPSPPSYARQGVRSCRALLAGAGAKTCIRDIVRRANARCRGLHSPADRTRCLQAVHRAGRSSK